MAKLYIHDKSWQHWGWAVKKRCLYKKSVYIIFNCGWLTQFSLIFESLFPKEQRYAIIWFLIFNCGSLICVLLLFWRNFSAGAGFMDIACFSILASGPHLDAAILQNIFRSSSIDAIIFNCVSLVLEDVSCRSRIPPII